MIKQLLPNQSQKILKNLFVKTGLVRTTLFLLTLYSNLGFSQACFTTWSSSTQYGPGTSCGGGSPFQVSYNGRNYTARYCNTNSRPDLNYLNSWDNWIDAGTCSACNAVNPGSIGTNQSIVTNTAPNTLTNISAASGGNGSSYTYQWQISTTNSTWTDISGATSITYSPGTLSVNTYFRRKASSCTEVAYTNSVLISIVVPIDSDGDGVLNHLDVDDDNDGILDAIECPSNNFAWSGIPSLNGNTATGSIGNANYSYISSVPVATTPNIFNHGIFPSSYGIPNTTSIQNSFISSNTLTFDRVIKDPVLVFASIGSAGLTVPIRFGSPIEILWSTAVTQVNSTEINGTEGFAIIRLNGTFSQISFNYLADEGYVNFYFGVDFTNNCDTDGDGIINSIDLDSDADGCPDAIEGGAAFTSSNLTNNRLSGSVDANGVPTIAGASGQTIGSSINSSITDPTCPACIDSDADGICDITDLDDDNDGILDVIECTDNNASWDFETPVVPSNTNNFVGTQFQGWTCTGGTINVIHPPYGASVPQTASSGNQYVEVYGSGDFSRVYTVSTTGIVTVEIDFANWAGVTESTQIKIFKSDGTTLLAQSPIITTTTPSNWSNAWLNRGSVSANLPPDNYIIKFFLGDYQAFDNVRISSASIANCDLDNDGIINSLDLDSDGDGCVDAIEGGAAFTTANLTANRLSGSVDANGVPTIAGSAGQTVGTSQNAIIKDASCASPTPISLLSFNAVYEEANKTVLLKWTTTTETNNDYFTIERSSNGQDWQIVSTRKGAGNSSQPLVYEMRDPTPLPDVSYYRLKQTDADGQHSYSTIVSVYFSDYNANYELYPNPASSSIQIIPNTNINNVQIVNSLGIPFVVVQTTTGFSINDFPAGLYFVNITNAKNEVTIKKLIIQK